MMVVEVYHITHSRFDSQLLLIIDRDLRFSAALLAGVRESRVGWLIHSVLVVNFLILSKILAIRVHLSSHATFSMNLPWKVRWWAVHVEVIQILNILLTLNLISFTTLRDSTGWIRINRIDSLPLHPVAIDTTLILSGLTYNIFGVDVHSNSSVSVALG